MGELLPSESRSVLLLSELAEIANRETRLGIEAGQDMLEHFARSGEALMEAKANVAHGEWLPWLDANFDYSPRTAQIHMRWARNAKRVSHLPPEPSLRKAMLSLTSSSTDATDETATNEDGGWESLQRDLHDEHGGVVNPALVQHAVRDWMRREEDRENERAKRQRETGQLDLFGVGDQAALEIGEEAGQVKPPPPAVYPGLPKAYTCPRCKYDWGRSTRPQHQLVVVSESAEGEQRERDLAFAQATVVGRIDLLADDLRELGVGQALNQETLDEVWVALGHLSAQMKQTGNRFRRSVREQEGPPV